MDDAGGGAAPDPGGESSDASAGGHGLVSFLTSLRGVISTLAALVIAIGGLVTALDQVGVIGDDGDAEAGSDGAASLFRPATRPNGRVYFDGNTMYVRASLPGQPLLHLADSDELLADVSLETVVEQMSGADDYAFGFVCRYRSAANYYLLSVLSGGRYHIVRYRDGRAFSLTHGIKQGAPLREGENRVYAKCVGEDEVELTLVVNGQEVATVEDPDGIESGTFGVRAGSGESFVTLKLDEFELRRL